MTTDPRNQWTTQGIASALWRDDVHQVGVYGALRRQDEIAEGRSTRAGVLDVFGSTAVSLSQSTKIDMAIEAAVITGKTNRSTTRTSPRRLHIRSAGAVGEAMVGIADGKIRAGASGGYASGDGDPSDDSISDFTFDRNFGVGMVLFDEVMGAIDAQTHTLASNPATVGQPPDGVDQVANEGAFRRAMYIQPRLESDPLDWLTLRTAVVIAASTAPYAHPYYTSRNGGVPVNQLNEPTSGYSLGHEVDWSVELTPWQRFDPSVSIAVQGGHAYLSENIGGAQVERVDRLLVVMRLQ
jgi:hypothetical protein